VRQLGNDIEKEQPDIILHAGDIGEVRNGLNNFRHALKIIGWGVQDQALVIGNHDLWTYPGVPPTSKELWTRVIPTICKEEGWHYLEQSNLIVNGVAFVGSYLHYDYSAKDKIGAAPDRIKQNHPDMDEDEYYERMKIQVVNDAKYFTGLPRDKDFAKLMGDAFIARLNQAEADESVHSIVIITHVPCMPSQITRKPESWHWSCATAYFGNVSYSEDIMKCSKVKYVFSGHSHQANDNMIEFHDGHEARVVTIGSDYGAPLYETFNIEGN